MIFLNSFLFNSKLPVFLQLAAEWVARGTHNTHIHMKRVAARAHLARRDGAEDGLLDIIRVCVQVDVA